ncbi:pyridoxamine 5'-phosphate oxidase family protein [Miniphocaeibacter halophilus]|uniref:Pyridoxamine 5'-phosphate oxidase family protein n=1 Tax=Miniphocaeibacter halophilus TaxID=2931922 RepID=A0AC61MN02_9FIRM|nr:pyridoxamine 5'-phosphate oxidase family protein [Miniphocaeibacter halophilus]QQK06984.1 pyridoxamine 5'-phosphate oxidase family protein [Miniphocaeibacter halophilus]
MRRSDREVTGLNNILSIAKNGDTIILAFNDKDFPYILPVNYGCELKDNNLYFYFHGALEGNKYKYIYNGARVSFEIDCNHKLVTGKSNCSFSMKYESLIGRGIIYEIKEYEEVTNALNCIMKQYTDSYSRQYDEGSLKKVKVFKIEVISITGKSNI